MAPPQDTRIDFEDGEVFIASEMRQKDALLIRAQAVVDDPMATQEDRVCVMSAIALAGFFDVDATIQEVSVRLFEQTLAEGIRRAEVLLHDPNATTLQKVMASRQLSVIDGGGRAGDVASALLQQVFADGLARAVAMLENPNSTVEELMGGARQVALLNIGEQPDGSNPLLHGMTVRAAEVAEANAAGLPVPPPARYQPGGTGGSAAEPAPAPPRGGPDSTDANDVVTASRDASAEDDEPTGGAPKSGTTQTVTTRTRNEFGGWDTETTISYAGRIFFQRYHSNRRCRRSCPDHDRGSDPDREHLGVRGDEQRGREAERRETGRREAERRGRGGREAERRGRGGREAEGRGRGGRADVGR